MSLKLFTKSDDSLLFVGKGEMVSDVVDRMIAQRLSAALVVSEEHQVIGIFTERDAMVRVVGAHLDSRSTPMGAVMTGDVITIEEDASLDAAIHCIQANQISNLPVVRGPGEVVGMITIRHLLHEKIKDLVMELRNVEAYWNDAPGG